MAFRVTLRPSGRAFEVPEGKTVLTAGLEAGLNLAYSCRAGSCTTCRGKILEGRVDYGRSNDHCLTPEQRAQGFALLCQAAPLTFPRRLRPPHGRQMNMHGTALYEGTTVPFRALWIASSGGW